MNLRTEGTASCLWDEGLASPEAAFLLMVIVCIEMMKSDAGGEGVQKDQIFWILILYSCAHLCKNIFYKIIKSYKFYLQIQEDGIILQEGKKKTFSQSFQVLVSKR